MNYRACVGDYVMVIVTFEELFHKMLHGFNISDSFIETNTVQQFNIWITSLFQVFSNSSVCSRDANH